MSLSILDIYRSNEINSMDLCNAFYSYSKKHFVPFNINNKQKREIELVFKTPSFVWLSILFNYKEKNIRSYIEVKNIVSDTLKTRLRKDISSFSFYIHNKRDLIDLFKKESQEGKYLINMEEYENQFIFKTADETHSVPSQEVKAASFFYVNSISLKNSYFTFEARVRTKLRPEDSKSNDLIISYFQANNDQRTLDVEIELNQELKELNEKEFKEKFLSILSFGVSGARNGFNFNYAPPVMKSLKTNMINITELLELNGADHLVTKKIDGESKSFYVRNSICHIINNHVHLELQTNIPSEYELVGMGEYLLLNNQRTIYPFWFEMIKKKDEVIEFKTRLESFQFYESILNQSTNVSVNSGFKPKIKVNEKVGMVFDSKEFMGPFNDQEDYMNACYKMFTSVSVFPTDGIIVMNNNQVTGEITDYKFKQHNTVDIYTNFTLPEKADDSLTSLNFGFYFYYKSNKTSKFYEFTKLKQSNSECFYYDNNLSMLVYQRNVNFEVYPMNFISEFNVTDRKFIPRLDKTSKMFIPKPEKGSKRFQPKKYYGNPLKIIISSIVLHKYKLHTTPALFSSLLTLDSSSLEKYISDLRTEITRRMNEEMNSILNKKEDRIELEGDEEDDVENIVAPLNQNKNWYKEESNISSRSALNHISNLNKTIGLNLAISPFVNSRKSNTLISIYCGRGGDMGKFITQDVSVVVGVDPDKNALEQFKARHKSYSETKNKTFNLTTIQLALEDKDFMLKLNKKTGLMTYDVIDCQLGIHFSFHKDTEDHIGNIFLKLVNRNKLPKTKLLISTNDKDNIISLFKKKQSDVLTFKIDESHTYTVSKKSDTKISVFYPASMNEAMEEYLMDKTYFISFLEKIGFNLIQTWNFNEIVENKSIYESLFKNYERTSTKNFMASLKDINLDAYDLKDLLSIFRYYIFEYKF